MFRHFSKITATTLKYTSSLFLQCNHNLVTSESMIEAWLQDIQIGLDAMLDDRIMQAEDIFTIDKASPFHVFGYAVLIYVKATLSLERTTIEEALDCISSLKTHIKRIITQKKRSKANGCSRSIPPPLVEQEYLLESQFQLLYANCILMLATLQFLRDSLIDHVKAAYDLRKAYKIYERIFETLTGSTLADYELSFLTHGGKATLQQQQQQQHTKSIYHQTVEHGAYFGIGLFNLIFSLLPSKVGKTLNSIGFHSTISTAIHLLFISHKGKTMYSSLSTLVLLTFYTNITMYIQPQMNHFFRYVDAQSLLQSTKLKYPNGRLWHLIHGKFERIDRNLDQAVALFTKAKEPGHMGDDDKPAVVDADTYFRNSSINEFTQFRSFAMYETGWTHVYAGNYVQATEVFFCLESVCSWSRLFYHYIATCCMIADGLYEKAALESRQLVNMFEHNRKAGHRISSNEQYAESKIASWIEQSKSSSLTLTETLQIVTNPIWELVYLWNGTSCWGNEISDDIKSQSNNKDDDPMLCLLLGVLYRDRDGNDELAIKYFNLAMKSGGSAGWITPYAMYEMATQCLSERENCQAIATDWIQRIEKYYQQHPQDKEWESRMQLRCQLLLESSSRM